jgi:hypothetical protein
MEMKMFLRSILDIIQTRGRDKLLHIIKKVLKSELKPLGLIRERPLSYAALVSGLVGWKKDPTLFNFSQCLVTAKIKHEAKKVSNHEI